MWIGSVQIFHNNRDKVFILQEIDIYLYFILTFMRIDARLSQKIMQDCVTFANIALAIDLYNAELSRIYGAKLCGKNSFFLPIKRDNIGI